MMEPRAHLYGSLETCSLLNSHPPNTGREIGQVCLLFPVSLHSFWTELSYCLMSVVGAAVEREAHQDATPSFSEGTVGFSLLGEG